jgi:anti-sigma factor RsiW
MTDQMPDCQRIENLVTPFVDGELAGADRDAVADHLRRCAPCHSRVAAEQAVRAVIRARKSALVAPPAPASLRAACASLSSRETPSGAVRSSMPAARVTSAAWRARLTPIAIAASLVILVGGAFVYDLTETSARVLAAELTADHVKCFAMNNLISTQQAAPAVESSMFSLFGWGMHLPENPADAGLELVGSRPCLYPEGKIAHIMYRHMGRPVSLFMLPKSARSRELVEVLGHQAAIWCVGDRTFVLISREPKVEVERMASYVQASMR